jgi:hypothetical protein
LCQGCIPPTTTTTLPRARSQLAKEESQEKFWAEKVGATVQQINSYATYADEMRLDQPGKQSDDESEIDSKSGTIVVSDRIFGMHAGSRCAWSQWRNVAQTLCGASSQRFCAGNLDLKKLKAGFDVPISLSTVRPLL